MPWFALGVCQGGCQVLAAGVRACQDLESSVWMKNEEKDSDACAVDRRQSKRSVLSPRVYGGQP